MKKCAFGWQLLLLAVMTMPLAASAASGEWYIHWPLDEGVAVHTATRSDKSLFAYDMNATGSNVPYFAMRETNGIKFTQFQPVTQSSSPTENDKITFTFKPQVGVTFTPTRVSLDGCRYGTSGGKLDIYLVCGDQRINLVKGANPNRNDDTSTYSFDVSSITNTTEEMTVEIYLYGLAANKQVGLANIKVAGTFEGTPESVPVYGISVQTNLPDAGIIRQAPVGDSFNENTQIALEAVANFGYRFLNWTNAAGDVVAETPAFTHTLTADAAFTANFETVNIYTLDLTIDGAPDYMVSLSDEGTMVDGKRMYEEGTALQLNATSGVIYTFTNWENGATSSTRTMKLTEDASLTAVYSHVPFICGWDFYKAGSGNRAGDIYNDSQNAGMLVLRKADGTTGTWLDRSALSSNPTYENRYAIVNWKPLADRYYYEASFSTKGYYNIHIQSSMLLSFNGYSVQKLQYSLDGETYKDFGEINIVNPKVWYDDDSALPAEAENQEKIYVRWIPDYGSPLVGTETTSDGTAMSGIYVLADQLLEDDSVAPQLQSSIPAADAVDITADGSIVLNFDEIVKEGTGNCTLNGQVLDDVTFSGATVICRYHNLDYNTLYTVNIPAGAIVDRSGNAFAGTSFSFTTMNRRQPEARLFDAVVAQDGSGDYATPAEAIAAAPAGRTSPWLIFIKEGYYKGHIEIPENKPYIYLIGQDKEKVTITDDVLCGGDNAVHVSVGASVVCQASDFYAENISFENEYGVVQNNGPQALAMFSNNDRICFYNCKLRSYQDTYLTSTKAVDDRHYLKDCFIEGAVDFIYGGGDVYFDECTLNIVRTSGGYIVAPSHSPATKWGYVFYRNRITAPTRPTTATDVWLGRPWHDACKTVFLCTCSEVTIPATGWYESMGTIPAIFADYKTTDAEGNLLDLSNRRDTYYYVDESGQKIYGKAKNALTDEEAATYTYANVLNGSDYWNPRELMEAVDVPEGLSFTADDKLSWTAVDYAMCYVVHCNNRVVGFTTEPSYAPEQLSDTDVYRVQAVNEYGSLGQLSEPLSKSSSLAPAVADDAFSMLSVEGGVTFRGILPGAQVEVFTPGGMILLSRVATASDLTVQLPLRGVYYVRVNGLTRAFVY